MPAEGRENPLLKKGNFDAFFREKYLTKNIYAKQQFQSGCVQHIQQRHGFPAQPLTSCPVLQGTVRGVLLQYTVRRSTPPVIQSAARAMDELWERNIPFLLAGN